MVFSVNARTVRARDQASCRRFLAFSALAFFLPRRSPLTRGWGRAAGEKECPSRRRLLPRSVVGETHRVGWHLTRPRRKTPGQPSIRVTPATAPRPLTLYARSVLDAQSR